jgi:CHAT domain-containing protein
MSRLSRWLRAPRLTALGKRSLVASVSLFFVPAGAQVISQPTDLIPGTPPAEFAVQPSSSVTLSIQVAPGQATTFTVQEEDQTSFVTWTDPSGKIHNQRTNRDGQSAKIRFTLAGSQQGSHLFAISTASKKKAARVLVRADVPHAETARDESLMATEEALAEGDFLWAKHDVQNAAAALAAYDQAIEGSRRLEDIAMLRRSLDWKAIYLAFTKGDAQAALPLATEATNLPDASDTAGQASAWKLIGMVQTTLADYPDGWQSYERSLSLFQKTGDRFNQEVLLENRGKLSRLTGDYAGALEDTDVAAAIARELDDQVGALHIEDEIGAIHLLRGEMQPAFDAYQDVLGLNSINPADLMLGFAETDLANLYHQLGGDTQASDMLARASEFWKLHPYLIGELATLDQQGKLAIDSGDLARASAIYHHGLELSQAAGTKREEVSFLLGMGRIAHDRREYGPAAGYLDRASQLAESLAAADAMVEIHIAQGDLALDINQPQDAGIHYRQALSIAEQNFNHPGTIAALGGLARTAWSAGHDQEARQNIERALAGIESTRDVIQESSLRTAYFSSRHSYYDLAIEILMHLDKQQPGAGYNQEALETAERARARSLREQMQQAGADVEQNIDPALVAARSKTLRDLHLAEASVAALRATEKNSPRAQAMQRQIAALLEEEDRIEAAVDRNMRERQASGAMVVATPPLSQPPQHLITELQHQMDPATALLEYWTGTNASYLWIITPASLRSFVLPNSETLQTQAMLLSSELRKPFVGTPTSAEAFAAGLNRAQEQFGATAARLGRILLPPHALANDLHTLLLVGDGPLLSMPLEALRLPSATANATYVQDKYSVVREPSIQVLLDLWKRHAATQPMKIAVIADPVFGKNDRRIPRQSAAQQTPSIVDVAESRTDWANLTGSAQLRRLSFAGPEATEIAEVAGPTRTYVATGFSASVDHVRSMDWQEYSIAHFATHALLNPSHPELAGIVLSAVKASGEPQPGILWLSDIYDLHMPVGMVVLSACQTSNGKLLPGEGLVGVSQAFFVAGARRVVGSLWDVDDAATEQLIREFYTALLQGPGSPAEALRRAQIKMSKDPHWENPYYWAGFTIEGDPRDLSQ